MQNRPTNVLREAEPESFGFERAALHRNPILRLSLLFVLMILPLGVVGGRLLTLQQTQADEFIAGFEPKLSESLQPIETTDGRILMDGLVLAEDVASYRLKMHYRLIEEPVDERWLRRKAYERLSSSDRRDKERVTAAEEQVQADRERIWIRLATALELSEDELLERRREIQKRVEHVVTLVE